VREPLDLVRVVRHEDERADAVVLVELGELPRVEARVDVVEAADLPRIPTRLLSSCVDHLGHRAERLGRGAAHADEPAVGLAAGEAQHPRLVGAQPDLDAVGGPQPAIGLAEPVVLALEGDRLVAVAPERADDVDRLVERVDALAGRPPRPAHALDPVPERAGAKAEVHAPLAEDVDARGGLRDRHGQAQRQVRDVGREVDPVRLRRDRRQQRERVEEAALVRVVLERDEVQALALGQPRELEDLRRGGRVRRDEHAEVQLVSVSGHVLVLC
jgi:hypothetical protein